MTSAQTQHTATTTNPRGFEATTSQEIPASFEGGGRSRPSTYSHVLKLIEEESYVLTVHQLEAFAEAAFDAYASNEPEPSYPYGKGFTAGTVLS